MARRRSERGQATVELVLVLPVIVLLALTVVQVAAVARDRVLVIHATREAARTAAVEPDPAQALAAAQAATGLDDGRLSVELGPERRSGERLTVVVAYRVPTDVPLVGPLLPDVDLQAEMTVRIE